MNLGEFVVVTTEYRGVFFGRLEIVADRHVTLSDARVCVYWDRKTRGFIGLAADGPTPGCRVSAACPRLELVGVTSIALCSSTAVKQWEAAPWQE